MSSSASPSRQGLVKEDEVIAVDGLRGSAIAEGFVDVFGANADEAF